MIEVAAALRTEVDRAAAYFRSLGEADVTRGRGSGKWVKKEILGHLIDSAANNHQRFASNSTHHSPEEIPFGCAG